VKIEIIEEFLDKEERSLEASVVDRKRAIVEARIELRKGNP